jgi:exodeoxyribonuclease VII small subunit
MPDERYTFETARIRLEEIAAEVRKKDTSLEKSLELLEEGVRLANICTELVDRADVSSTGPQAAGPPLDPASPAPPPHHPPAD